MSNEQIDYTLFETATKEFYQHLSVKNNDRILFSGKFGHGKTTFLKYFFNEKKYSEKYQSFYLYPVNYSVASNEDIFEYIKYDILIEMLLSNEYTFEHIDITKWQSLSFFLAKAPEKIIQGILGMMSKTGNTDAAITEDFANSIINLNRTLEEINQQDKENLSEVFKVKNLLSKIESKEGSIYESNAITQIIRNALSNKTDKQKVLIIDDLDRIDPEHIFRILNVFAAHLDNRYNEPNKFGFDKIILVCDIENIRNIFRAKYGIKTDFNGYIDKYYSHKIFNYDIKQHMTNYASMIFGKSLIAYGDIDLEPAYGSHIRDNIFTKFFKDVFKLLVDVGEIDMRNIIKWRNMNALYYTYAYTDNVDYNTNARNFLLGIRMLTDIKGSSGGLKRAIEEVAIISPLSNNFRAYCNELAYIYLLPIHKNEFRKTPNRNRFLTNINGNNLHFQLGDSFDDYGIDESHLLNTTDFIFLFNNVIDMIANRKITFER